MVEVPVHDIYGRAQSALANSPIFELRDLVVVHEEPDSLVLSGTVSSYYHKQMAQEVVRTVCQSLNVEVINSIEVK